MAFQTTWRVVDQIDTNCRPTKKGDPQISVRTDKGEWIKISGQGIEQIKVGNKIEISEPGKFGQSWYARLNAIETPSPKQEAKPEAPATNNNGHAPATSGNTGGKISWAEFELAFREAHKIAVEVEPDKMDAGMSTIDRSGARAALVNTAMIAFSQGRIEAPEPGPEVPF